MSNEASACCWGKSFPVESDLPVAPSTIRLVALAIADVVNDMHHNEFYGSITKLAEKTGLSRETAGLAVKHLQQVGVVRLLERRPGGSTRYRWMGVQNDHLPDGPSVTHLTEPSDRYLTEPSDRGCRNHPSLSQEKPRSKPKALTGLRPGCDTHEESGEPRMEFGRNPEEKVPPSEHIRPRRKQAADYGPNTDSQEVVKTNKPSYHIMVRMDSLWPSVVQQVPDYWSHKLYDGVAFAKYLNDNFFAPDAKTPMTLTQVYGIIDRFMNALRERQFNLKSNQPVWLAFTARWHKYVDAGAVDMTGYVPVPRDQWFRDR